MTSDEQQKDLGTLEAWLDNPDCTAPSDQDRPLAEALVALRQDYHSLRYTGPAPQSLASAGNGLLSGWLRPALVMATLSAVAIATWLTVRAPAVGPEGQRAVEWVADSPAAQLRALRGEMSSALMLPDRPQSLSFRIPARPNQPSGFAPQKETDPQSGVIHSDGDLS